MTGWDGHEVTDSGGWVFHAAVLGPRDAPAVVCVHGLGCSYRYFLPLARSLVPEARVVAVDLPGFGRSRGPRVALDVPALARALATWLRVTGRAGSALVANSMGCQVVADLAARAPELPGPVVLAGPTVDRYARTAPRQLARLVRDVRFERLSLPPLLVRDYLRAGLPRVLATFRHTLRDPVEAKLPSVRSPAVVVRGERDPIVGREWAREVAALLPLGRYEELPGAGHAVNYSAPDGVARVTLPLLTR